MVKISRASSRRTRTKQQRWCCWLLMSIAVIAAGLLLPALVIEHSNHDDPYYTLQKLSQLMATNDTTQLSISAETTTEQLSAPTDALPPVVSLSKQEPEDDTSQRKHKTTNTTTIITKATMIPSPLPENARLAIQPLYGQHRINVSHAMFSFARGFSLDNYLPFVTSLYENTNFTGDLVLGVSTELDDELHRFFSYLAAQYHVVVYEIPLECIQVKIRTHCHIVGMFVSTSDPEIVLPDSHGYREMAQLRFEYYWAWSTLYNSITSDSSTSIWMLDARDLYFQSDFMGLHHHHRSNNVGDDDDDDDDGILHVFEESNIQPIWKQRSNRRWIKAAYTQDVFYRMKYMSVVCSGTIFGTSAQVVQDYTAAMIHQFDVTNCTVYGCDQGHHNYLVRLGLTGILNIQVHEQGAVDAAANTIGLLVTEKGNLTDLNLINADGQVLSNDGQTISPMIHQYDRDLTLQHRMFYKKRQLLRKWRAKLSKQ